MVLEPILHFLLFFPCFLQKLPLCLEILIVKTR